VPSSQQAVEEISAARDRGAKRRVVRQRRAGGAARDVDDVFDLQAVAVEADGAPGNFEVS